MLSFETVFVHIGVKTQLDIILRTLTKRNSIALEI